jgi:hypothetical protein
MQEGLDDGNALDVFGLIQDVRDETPRSIAKYLGKS